MREIFSLENICPVRLNRIAKAIHTSFLEDGHNPTDQAAQDSWNRLPEYVMEANRKPSEHLEVKCLSVGCDVAAGEIPTQEILEKHMQALSRMEPNRWMAEKLLHGWNHGSVTDNKARTHKNLVSWEQLPENEKEKDRTQIRAIPVTSTPVLDRFQS